MDGIICFVKVNLEEHRTKVFGLDLMDDFMKDKNTIKNISTFREGRLIRVVNPRGDQGRPSGVPLGQNLKDNIKDCVGL